MELELPELDGPTTELVSPGPPVGRVLGMKVGVYARISYAKGDEKEAAIDRQLADCREWARLRGHEVVAEYVDPHTSAFKKVRRDHFERMLADLDAGAIDGVVVWKLDRLVRNHADFERFEEIRAGRDALLAAVHEPIDTSTELGMLIVRLLVGFARLESANNSLRTKAAMAEGARNGHRPGGGSRPFGLTADWTEIVPVERDLVVDAAKAVLAGGFSLTSIARDWNDGGVQTPNGAVWRTAQVRRLLTSPRIAGLREHNGEIVAIGTWPALIDRATYDRLVTRIESRAMSPGRPHKYLLTGVLQCGHCHKPMTGAYNKPCRTKGEAIAYRCLPTPGRDRCGRITVSATKVDALVAEEIAQRFANFKSEPTDDGEAELQAQIARDQERLAEVGGDYADGAIPRATYLAAVDRLEARIEATSRRLARTTVIIPTGGADAIREAWSSRSMAWRRSFVARVITSIEVLPAKVAGGPFDSERIRIAWTERPGGI